MAQKLDCRHMEFTARSHKSIVCSLDYLEAGCSVDNGPAGLSYVDAACDKPSVLASGRLCGITLWQLPALVLGRDSDVCEAGRGL